MSQLTLNADTSGYVTLSTAATVTSYTFQLPSAAPAANGAYLSATTGGVASWSTLGPATYATMVGYTTTATAAGTTTLTSSSTYNQFFTGTTTQTVQLPDVTTLATGWTFHISNNSTGNLTVNSSGGNLISTVLPGTSLQLVCILTTGTTAASWDYELIGFTTPTGTGNVVLATSPTITTATLTNPTVTNYVETYYNVGTVTTTATIDLANGTLQTLTLTASTTCTVTMPTATAGKSFVLLVRQAATTGNGAVTWSSVKWGSAGTPTVTATAAKMDIFTFVADGTNWYGSAAQGYTP